MDVSEMYNSAIGHVTRVPCTTVKKNGSVVSGVAEDWNNDKINKQWVLYTSGGNYVIDASFNLGTLKPWEFCIVEILRDNKSVWTDGAEHVLLDGSGKYVYLILKSCSTLYINPYSKVTSAVDIHRIRMWKVAIVKDLTLSNETCSQQYLTCSSYNYSASTKTINTLNACLTSGNDYDPNKAITISTSTNANENVSITHGGSNVFSLTADTVSNTISLSNKVPESYTSPMKLIGISVPNIPYSSSIEYRIQRIYSDDELDINSFDVPLYTTYKLNHALPMVTPPSASITSLEPNNVPQLVSNAITVSWEASPFNRCYVDVGNLKYGPLTVKSLTIPANTLEVGNTNIKLTVYPYANLDLGMATATATFLVYGPPKAPELSLEEETYSNIPTISWTGVGQVAYEVQILQGTTVKQQSNTVVSTTQSYTCTMLTAGAYSVKVRIRNEYNLWSPWAEATFTIKETVIDKPIITQVIKTTKPSIIIFYSVTEDATKVEILKRKQGMAWETIYSGNVQEKCEDIAVGSRQYEYKVRVFVNESANESDISLVDMKGLVEHFNFTTLTTYKRAQLIYEPEITRIPNLDIALTQYQGRSGPIAERGEVKYNSYSFSFWVTDEQLTVFEDVLYSNEDVFYCDHRGNEGYIALSNVHIGDVAPGWYEISFSGTEVSI